MPRVTKSRKICCLPKSAIFHPENDCEGTVTLTFDEIEAIRLADLEMLDQDSASEKMEVSRATFQRILYSAHKTIADALVNGKSIEIKGGSYTVADNPCNKKTVCANCRFEEEK